MSCYRKSLGVFLQTGVGEGGGSQLVVLQLFAAVILYRLIIISLAALSLICYLASLSTPPLALRLKQVFLNTCFDLKASGATTCF